MHCPNTLAEQCVGQVWNNRQGRHRTGGRLLSILPELLSLALNNVLRRHEVAPVQER